LVLVDIDALRHLIPVVVFKAKNWIISRVPWIYSCYLWKL